MPQKLYRFTFAFLSISLFAHAPAALAHPGHAGLSVSDGHWHPAPGMLGLLIVAILLAGIALGLTKLNQAARN